MQKGWSVMRRAMLLFFGFGAGGIVLLLLIVVVQGQENGDAIKAFLQYDTFYPRSVMGTDLLAVQALEYNGPFWEDGSNEEVSGVAALLVENQGGLMVSSGAVIVEMEKEWLVFEISFLPPGGKVLVLEKDRKNYTSVSAITCYGWTREEYPENPGLVSVETMGLSGLLLTNHTGCTVPSIQVHYKNYDPEKGMFLGGISYCVTEEDLMPREVRLLNPTYFAARESRIVSVYQEMDR